MNRTPQKDWTVMIYMAGDNDLDNPNDRTSEAIKDLELIKRIGSKVCMTVSSLRLRDFR